MISVDINLADRVNETVRGRDGAWVPEIRQTVPAVAGADCLLVLDGEAGEEGSVQVYLRDDQAQFLWRLLSGYLAATGRLLDPAGDDHAGYVESPDFPNPFQRGPLIRQATPAAFRPSVGAFCAGTFSFQEGPTNDRNR